MFAMRKNDKKLNSKINFCTEIRYPYDTDFKECCQEDVIGENGEPSNLFNLVRSDECAEIGGTVVVSGQFEKFYIILKWLVKIKIKGGVELLILPELE